LAFVLVITLSPVAVLAQTSDDQSEATTPEPAIETDPVAALRVQVEQLLQQAQAEFATVDEMLFDDPENADLLALHADLGDTIGQLEVLLAQLTDSQVVGN